MSRHYILDAVGELWRSANWTSVPGDTLQDWLDEQGITPGELAKKIGRSKDHVTGILQGHKRISALTALHLERVTGMSANFWLRRQANHDLWIAAQGPAIHALRIARRITLRKFCQELGIDPAFWSKVERGLAVASLDVLRRAHKFLEGDE